MDFSDLQEISAVVAEITKITPHPRSPYVGELVFTAFSGSHQDAIKKGFDIRRNELKKDSKVPWAVPYLTIDPSDTGRSYEAIIRINSQSGKGGIAYILDREHGFDLPKTMHPQVGGRIYALADFEMTDGARAQLDAYLDANRRGKHGRVLYDLQGDFGVDPSAVRERFDFYFDRFPVRKEGL